MRHRNDSRRRSLRLIATLSSFALAFFATQDSRAQTRAPIEFTLEQALDQAFLESPVLRVRRAEVRQAEARLLGSRTYPFNPEIELAMGDRQSSVDSSTDRAVSISQEIEIGGQRGKRSAVAMAELEAMRSGFGREQRLLSARVRLAFAETLRARELLRVAETDAELTGQLLDFASRRLEAGAGTQVELNLAQSTAGRTERSLRLAQATDAAARGRLAEVMGLQAGGSLVPRGELALPPEEMASVEELVGNALGNRADLEALRNEAESARRATELAKSLRVPNLRFGAFYEQEEGTDDIKGVGLALPIPIFNRNQGEIAETQAVVERLSAESSVAELAVHREVVEAAATYRAARLAAVSLRDLVVGTLEDNISLLRRAFDAGKIDTSDVLVFRREFVEGQRQFVEALFDAQSAQIALDLATGSSTQIPTTTQRETHHDQ